MKHIFFNNNSDCVYTGSSFDEATNTPDDPRIRIFNADTITALSFDVSATTDVCSDRFVIVQSSNQGIVTSPILEKKNVVKVKTTQYVGTAGPTFSGPVAQVTTLGDFPNPVTGTEYSVKVVDVTNGYEPYPVQTATVVATSAINTAAKLIEALEDAFNNNSRSLVEATSTTTTLVLTGALPSLQTQEGISITSSPLAQSFSTSLSEELAGVTLVATSAPRFGSGTYNHVRYLEETSQGGQGFLYRATPFRAEKPVFYSDPALTYDLVSILYRTNTTPNIAKSNTYVEYILAIQSGATIADLLYLQDTFFG